jgi:beta-lactamase regulating signal transducer with metallopeptidase domain
VGRLSVQAAVVVIAIVLVQRAARRWLTPQWRYALWTVLLLRLLVVYAFPASFSIYNATEWAATASVSPAPVVDSSPTAQRSTPAEVQYVSLPATRQATSFNLSGNGVRKGLAAVWVAGMLVLGGTVVSQTRRAARAVSQGMLVTDAAALSLLESCRKSLGLRTWLTLVETQAVKTPTLMGALRPKLLLPQGLRASLSEGQLRHVFLHELMHFKRGDIWSGWLMNLLLVVHWFNPVLWWARRRILGDRECACDAAVLAALEKGERGAYGETMLDLAERLVLSRWAPGMAGILETSSNFKRRIDMIAGYKPRTRRATVVGLGLLLLLGAVGLTNAKGNEPILSAEKAEMMGRVEDFFCHNGRDISARKSLEWGDVEKDKDGNRSIRYMCEARIWDKETMILNAVFTFKPSGEFVSMEKVAGYPKKKEAKAVDTASKEGLQALVEDFFQNNFRDITARKTLEWGDLETLQDGNKAIRYKYEARIWDKETVVQNKRFVFKPDGEFVRVEDVEAAPAK